MIFQKNLPGVHPPYHKELTHAMPIRQARVPERVVIPLSQHTGAPCEPLVKVGDEVKVGTPIGEGKEFVSSTIHSSICGKVSAIKTIPHPVIGQGMGIVIEKTEDREEFESSIKPRQNPQALSPEEIRQIIHDCGIVGLGGAAFPTHVKLSPPENKRIDSLILNGAECEPYLTCDHRLMLEHCEDIIKGLFIIMKTVEVNKAYIAIERNKPDAVVAMKKAIKVHSSQKIDIKVVGLKTKYPQGAEKQLISTILNRTVPSGGLPFDVGVLVNNVATTLAIYEAITYNKPLYERVVTLSGKILKEPANLRVRIGTPIKDLIEECGGFTRSPEKVIMGGVMMGLAQWSLEVPVIKGTTGIIFMDEKEALIPEEINCVKCARCVDVCPVNLLPVMIRRLVNIKSWSELNRYYIADCIECGACAYICPAKIPLVQLIKLGKAHLK